MLILGLTGSIGMGKSATAAMFAEEGILVHDADRAVHDLYQGDAVPLVEAAFPGVSVGGGIDRERLAKRVLNDTAAMKQLEAIVHPLVRREGQRFLDRARQQGARIVVFDIPLLFETGGERRVDAVVVVSAPAQLQRSRVMAREGMTEEKFAAILGRQMPDAEKRRRAHFIVDTSRGFDSARTQVRGILRAAAVIPGGAAARMMTEP